MTLEWLSNLEFWLPKKRTKLPELGSGGVGGFLWLGQCPKENVFFPLRPSLIIFLPLWVCVFDLSREIQCTAQAEYLSAFASSSLFTLFCAKQQWCVKKNLLYHIWTVGNPWLTKIKGNSLRNACLVKIKPSILLRLYSLSRHWSSKGKYFLFQATEFSRTTSPPRRALHFATGNKPSRISLTCQAHYRLPLQWLALIVTTGWLEVAKSLVLVVETAERQLPTRELG